MRGTNHTPAAGDAQQRGRRLALFMLAAAVLISARASARAQGSPAPPVTEPMSYTAANPAVRGAVFNLRAVRGHFVTVGFPDSWLDAQQGGLNGREAQSLVDLVDVAYSTMSDLVGASPARPSGLGAPLVIAVVETGSLGGYTPLGTGQVEVSTRQLALVRDAIRRGTLADIIVHEMCHAFDPYHAYVLDYYADAPHAWTEMLIPLVNYRMRAENFYSNAAGGLADQVSLFTSRWDAKSPVGAPLWSQCVQQGQGCEADGIRANRAWAGMMLRYVRLFGTASLQRSLARIGESQRAVAQPGATAADRNDFLVEALAVGAGADLSCVMEAWRWEVGAAARGRMRDKFPAATKQCADADGDGFSPAQADPDDNDPARAPDAADLPNSRDDDGDGYTDDRVYDAGGAASPQSQATGFPLRLRGTLRSGSALVRASFNTTAPRTVLLRAMSATPGWGFVVRVRAADATPLETSEEVFTNVDGITRDYVPLPRASAWLVEVQGIFAPGQTEGAYDVVITEAAAPGEPTPEAISLDLSPAAGDGAFSVATRVAATEGALPPGTRLAFWSSRSGLVKMADVGPDGSVTPWVWRADAVGWGANAPTGLRAQLLVAGVPATRAAATVWAGRGGNMESVVLPAHADVTVIASGGGVTRSATTGDVINFEFEIHNEGSDDGAVTAVVQLDPLLAITAADAAGGRITVDRAAHTVTFRAERLRAGGHAAVWVAATAPGAGGRTVFATATTVGTSDRLDFTASNDSATASVQIWGPSRCPVINSFTASLTKVVKGSPLVLAWDISNADAGFVNGVAVAGLKGSAQFAPASSTTYTLTATRDGCGPAARDLFVEVGVPQPVDYDIRSLPLRADNDPTVRKLALGGLARLTISLPGFILQTQTLGRAVGGGWADPQVGLSLSVNGIKARLVSASPAGATAAFTFTLDFVVPHATGIGGQVVVAVSDATGATLLAERRVSDAGASIVESAPALWTASGQAVAMNAWTFASISDSNPAKAGDRILLFASGLGIGVTTTVTAVKSDGSTAALPVEGVNEFPSMPGVYQIRVQLPDSARGAARLEVQVQTGKGSDSQRASLPVE